MKKTQHGFSVVEGLLIFVIVAIIGGTGWYVMSANSKTNDTLNKAGLGTAVKSSKKKQASPTAAPPAAVPPSWKAYTNKEGNFSLEYPAAWATSPHPEFCASGSLLLGANSSSVGRCGSDSGSQMYVSSISGDTRTTSELQTANYPDLKTEAITVNGVVGKKQTGTFKGTGEGLGPSDGTQTVAYTFYSGGRTYSAVYDSKLDDTVLPNVLSDFNLMVTKTLKFSAN
jgi:hypothetical protein